MGDPKKQRKKYRKPLRPWDSERLKNESKILKEFGLLRKTELWKMEYILKGFKNQAKQFIAKGDEQSRKEEKDLLKKLYNLKLLDQEAKREDILGIKLDEVLKRRLQSIVFAKGISRTVKQARQFILHGHVELGGKKITVPSYLVKREEEEKIFVSPLSSLADEDHPEMKRENATEKILENKQIAEEVKKTEKNKLEEVKEEKKEAEQNKDVNGELAESLEEDQKPEELKDEV